MRRLLAAALAATVLFLPALPAHAGPGAGQQGDRGPEVQMTASLDCSEHELVFWFVIQNTGPTVLHIDGTVHGVLRVPPREVLKFWLTPAAGWDVIEPGGEVRFGIPAWVGDPPLTFEAERITFGVDVQFQEKKVPVVRHTVLPGC